MQTTQTIILKIMLVINVLQVRFIGCNCVHVFDAVQMCSVLLRDNVDQSYDI